MAKKKSTTKTPARVLTTPADFVAARQTRQIAIGDCVAYMRDPTLAEAREFEQLSETTDGIEVGGKIAAALLVDADNQPIFAAVDEAVETLTITQLGVVADALNTMKDSTSAEKN